MEFLRFLWTISWKQILIATSAGLISGSGNALIMSLINQEVHRGHINNALFYFVIMAIFILISSIISQFMLINLSQNAVYKLRLQLSENILLSPLEHLEELRANKLIVVLTDDINQLTRAVSAIPIISIDLTTVVGCFMYLAIVSNGIFLLTLISTVMTILIVQNLLFKAHKLFRDAREEEDTLFKHFQGIITGTKELKLNRATRQAFLDSQLDKSAFKLRQKNSKALKSVAIANGFGQFVEFCCLAIVLFILPLFIYLPLSILGTYVLIGSFIAVPMKNLLNRSPELMQGNVSLRKIQRLKLSLINVAEFDNIPPPICPYCQLQLQQITYHYHEEFPPVFPQVGGFPPPSPHPFSPDRFPPPPEGFPPPPDEPGFALGPITLYANPGELVFIVGGNGSGKSTLAKLITGLYTPHSGSIYLNGELITTENIEWYRQHFSAIFSDVYLFDSYLGFNNPNLDEQIKYYLEKLQLAHKVTVNNGVLSTTNLSHGQRKRLALLTAYLEDRPIYVFDEWASDQDPGFREIFYTEIITQLKQQGKIVIIITHDDRYFYLADHLVKLNYGQVEFEERNS